MVYRIYVEKKPGFDGEAQSLRNELVSLLGIKELNGLRLPVRLCMDTPTSSDRPFTISQL